MKKHLLPVGGGYGHVVIQSNLNEFEKMSSKKFNDRIWRIDMEKHDVVAFRPYPFEKGQKLQI